MNTPRVSSSWSTIPIVPTTGSLETLPSYPQSVHDIPMINENITEIAREILQIVIVHKGKTIKDINKIFQATLSNYFFECYVCGLIASHSLAKESKRSIKRRVDQRLSRLLNNSSTATTTAPTSQNLSSASSRKRKNPFCGGESSETNNNSTSTTEKCSSNSVSRTPKYIYLIQAYSDEICQLNLTQAYIDMLTDTITAPVLLDVPVFSQRSSSSLSSSVASNHATAPVMAAAAATITTTTSADLTAQSKKYATAYQKKLCALFVLEFHLNHLSHVQHSLKDAATDGQQLPLPSYSNFSEIWNSVFKHFPINYFARERNIVSGKVMAINTPTNSSSAISSSLTTASASSSMRQATIKNITQHPGVTSKLTILQIFSSSPSNHNSQIPQQNTTSNKQTTHQQTVVFLNSIMSSSFNDESPHHSHSCSSLNSPLEHSRFSPFAQRQRMVIEKHIEFDHHLQNSFELRRSASYRTIDGAETLYSRMEVIQNGSTTEIPHFLSTE